MSLHTRPPVPREPPPNLNARLMEVVVVTRAAVERDGWPHDYGELREKAEACVSHALRDSEAPAPEYSIRRMSLGDLTQAAYTPLNLAFFRKGDRNLACLIAQAWM